MRKQAVYDLNGEKRTMKELTPGHIINIFTLIEGEKTDIGLIKTLLSIARDSMPELLGVNYEESLNLGVSELKGIVDEFQVLNADFFGITSYATTTLKKLEAYGLNQLIQFFADSFFRSLAAISTSTSTSDTATTESPSEPNVDEPQKI